MKTKQRAVPNEGSAEVKPSPQVYRPDEVSSAGETSPEKPAESAKPVKEIGGREGPEPTRFGDWEKNGRCIDF